jgi:NAD(P)-dependent dehydrogenase (short-subunit alcohol dehydrogenase family)
VTTVSLAVVTGGASGIGAAVTAQLRASGRTVVMWDIAEPHDIRCDVSDAADVDAAMARTIDTAGAPAALVACAGVGHSGLLVDDDPEAFRRVLDVNVVGTWLTMRSAARAMIEAGTGGSIVAISSISAERSDRTMGAYCASKAAVDMLVRVAAVEWGRHDIRVNAVGPGVTQTPMLSNAAQLPGWLDAVTERTALGRIGTPADIAAAAVALLDLEWVTGQTLHADGGLSLHSPIDSYGASLRAGIRTER